MRVNPGDVFRFQASSGYVLLQFLGVHSSMGECVLCCKSPDGTQFNSEKAHLFFYPLKLNIRNKTIEYCRHEIPCQTVPWAVRRAFVTDKKVQYWFIDDQFETRKVSQLSSNESDLPIGTIVSHVVLKEIYEGVKWFLFEDVDLS